MSAASLLTVNFVGEPHLGGDPVEEEHLLVSLFSSRSFTMYVVFVFTENIQTSKKKKPKTMLSETR